MSNKKRMRYFCAMMVLFMVFSISTNSQAVEFATTTNSVKESVEDYVEDWFYDNFSEHYTLWALCLSRLPRTPHKPHSAQAACGG